MGEVNAVLMRTSPESRGHSTRHTPAPAGEIGVLCTSDLLV